MRAIDKIVIHCAATKPDQDVGVFEIRRWHKARGWRDVGYHYVIRLDGAIEVGRDENDVGAHASGYNSTSIGVCVVGGLSKWGEPKENFMNAAQKGSLKRLVRGLTERYPTAEVLGHRDLPDVKKACPCFDVKKWWKAASKG